MEINIPCFSLEALKLFKSLTNKCSDKLIVIQGSSEILEIDDCSKMGAGSSKKGSQEPFGE